MVLFYLLIAVGFFVAKTMFDRLVMQGRDVREEEALVSRVAKAGMGVVSPVGNPQENLATVFSFGRKMPRQDGSATVFEAPVGWRYGFLAVVGFLGYFTLHFEANGGAGQTPVGMYLLIFAALAYTGGYIWGFRLTIDGTQMTCTDFMFRTQQFDLTKLIAVRKTKDGYKLYFEDRRMANVPLFVEGHDVLMEFLIEELEANGY